MPTASFYWTTANAPVSTDFLVRRNIKKRVVYPRFQGSFGPKDIPCAYIGTKEISPKASLDVVHHEDSLRENSRSSFNGELQFHGQTGYYSSRYFLLTDVIGDYSGSTATPFYWKHVLPDTTVDPDSVAILDKDLNEVREYSYRTVRTEARDSSDVIVSGTYESVEVFSNYRNSYSKDTGELKIYYVRFQVSGTTHFQLLNNEPAFSEATLDDVSSVTNRLKWWRKVYIVSPGSMYFTLTTPRADQTYYVKPLQRSRLEVLEPDAITDEQSWLVSVSNGSFVSIVGDQSYTYSVPEFSNQTFNPLEPYKTVVNERALHVAPSLLKVSKTPTNIDTSIYCVDIVVKDSEENILYAFTTESSRNGDYFYDQGERIVRSIETDNVWIQWDSGEIIGWDEEGGFLQLGRKYPSGYRFDVTYRYKETAFELANLNLNPVFDSNYDGHFYSLYVVPTGGSNDNTSQTRSLHYIKVDRSGYIVETSQDGLDENYNLRSVIENNGEKLFYTRSLLMETSLARSIGSSTIVIDKTSINTLLLPSSGILFVGEGINQNLTSSSSTSSFFVSYSAFTEETDTVTFHLKSALTVALSTGIDIRLASFRDLFSTASTTDNEMRWFILSEMGVRPTSRIEDLSIIDIRQRGNTIKDEYWSEAMKIDPRIIWTKPYCMRGKGQPIPGETAVVVKIPFTLLEDYGGDFTYESIESIVRDRHLAMGVVPIILYVGAIPEIASLSSTTSTITVCWHSEGTGYGYNVYYSFTKDGPWTKANSSLITDQTYGNCHTITGLSSGYVYYISVTSVDSNSIESPMGVAWGIRTRRS